MADNEPKKVISSILGGWVKAVMMGVLGLTSGAVIMYLTPLVDRVIKPAKPLANFGIQVDGPKVTFVNQAEGSEGWWDFGDGTPLQPFAPEQKSVTHEYPKKGGYTAKLTLRNLIGEENHREVNVQIDGTPAKPPSIDLFDIQPLEAKRYAPASFKIKSQISGAELCVWAFSAEHPLEVIPDPPAAQERYVTFVNPGKYLVKLAVTQGNQIVEKTQTVEVLPAPYATPMAVVQVKNQASWFKSTQREHNVKVDFPSTAQGPAVSFTKDVLPSFGCQIASASISPQVKLPPFIQNLKVTPAANGTKAVLTGEYLPAQAKDNKGQVLHWVAPVLLAEQVCGKPTVKTSDPVVMRLQAPGVTMIPLQKISAGWKFHSRQVQLELFDGSNPVWKVGPLPTNAPIAFYGQQFLVTATETPDALRIEVKKNNSPPAPPPLFGGN